MNTKQLDLLKLYIGDLKGLKNIGKIIHSDPRAFKKEITSLGIEIPHPGSIWTKVTQHLDHKFFKPIPDWLEEIIIGSLLGDAQIRLQSKGVQHPNNPTIDEYSKILNTTKKIRSKALVHKALTKDEISFWNYAVNTIRHTNTANLRIHKSIFEIEWIKFLKGILEKHIELNTYVKPVNYPTTKWSCGFDTASSVQLFNIWIDWYRRSNSKNKKIVPRNFDLTPNILLHWYLDDGYMSGQDIALCSQAFTVEENKYLIDTLLSKGIKCKISMKRNQPFIRISSEKKNKQIFFSYIEQAKFFEKTKDRFLHKFGNDISKAEWKERILKKYPECIIQGEEAGSKLLLELKK